MNIQVDSEKLEQEIRSLKFELSQQSEILSLKTDTLTNLQDQLEV